MKRFNKILVLLSTLFVGSSFASTNNVNHAVVAEASSSATLASDWQSKVENLQSVDTIIITNNPDNKVPQNSYPFGTFDVDTDSNASLINAYVYLTQVGKTCVIYAENGAAINVDSGANLFSNLNAVKKITFDCSMDVFQSTASMFLGNSQLATIEGLNNLIPLGVTDMSYMFLGCTAIESLDLSSIDLTFASNLNGMIETATNLKEIKAPTNMSGKTITLPAGFYTTVINDSMQGTTILRGSKELNELVNTLRSLDTCLDYKRGPELQAIYEQLNSTDKETFATLTDSKDVLLIDKLNYMVVYAASKATPSATAEKNMVVADIASQSPVLIMLIGCLSLAFIGGYYFVQKRKYAK